MRANKIFLSQSKSFWANVRTISQELKYSDKGQIRVHGITDIIAAFRSLGLDESSIVARGRPTPLGGLLVSYFAFRAEILNEYVEPRLMDVEEARKVFQNLNESLRPSCPIPLNKQKGEKSGPAYFTGIVNMLIEANVGACPVDYDPRHLTTITRGNSPLRTLSRRVDGCFPMAINPIAIWEIKEYYYTTTFGSRVADGVYETLLDGMELQELGEHENIHVEHLLMIDSRRTWWEMGRSYLCRIIDMLHTGYVDEVLFGREVVERLPAIAQQWVHRLDSVGGPR